MKRGNLIIIPDENQILSPIFSEDIIGKVLIIVELKSL